MNNIEFDRNPSSPSNVQREVLLFIKHCVFTNHSNFMSANNDGNSFEMAYIVKKHIEKWIASTRNGSIDVLKKALGDETKLVKYDHDMAEMLKAITDVTKSEDFVNYIISDLKVYVPKMVSYVDEQFKYQPNIHNLITDIINEAIQVLTNHNINANNSAQWIRITLNSPKNDYLLRSIKSSIIISSQKQIKGYSIFCMMIFVLSLSIKSYFTKSINYSVIVEQEKKLIIKFMKLLKDSIDPLNIDTNFYYNLCNIEKQINDEDISSLDILAILRDNYSINVDTLCSDQTNLYQIIESLYKTKIMDISKHRYSFELVEYLFVSSCSIMNELTDNITSIDLNDNNKQINNKLNSVKLEIMHKAAQNQLSFQQYKNEHGICVDLDDQIHVALHHDKSILPITALGRHTVKDIQRSIKIKHNLNNKVYDIVDCQKLRNKCLKDIIATKNHPVTFYIHKESNQIICYLVLKIKFSNDKDIDIAMKNNNHNV